MKKVFIIFTAIALFIILLTVTLKAKEGNKKEEITQNISSQKNIKNKILPENLPEINLAPRSDAKAVYLEIDDVNKVSSIEYELSYETEEGLPRGVVSSPIEIRENQKSLRREILLGTCSKNVCTFDRGVASVKILVKFLMKDGSEGEVEKEIEL